MPNIPIIITIPKDFINKNVLSTDKVNELRHSILDSLLTNLEYLWRNEAKRGLRGTRETYLDNLSRIDEGRFQGSIMLVGWLPNALEEGADAFDMKDGFKKSSKAKTKRDGGWYLTVPFRFATSKSLGENQVFSTKLPKEVEKVLKSKPTFETGKGERTKGLRISEIPKQFKEPGRREAIKTEGGREFGQYTHKVSIYAGVQRALSPYTKRTYGTYGSFRRISDQSDPNSWIHTGLRARQFADKALKQLDVPGIVNKRSKEFLDSLEV